jgi:nucleotide-binding universal stress UspA family protein
MFQKILVPLDGSLRAERALPVAARLARAFGSTMLLVSATGLKTSYGPALAPYPVITPSLLVEARGQAEYYLSMMAASKQLVDLKTETLISHEDAVSAILAAIEERHVDLVVMCSHGRTGIKRWALGSVAEKVSHHTPHISLLLARVDGSLPLPAENGKPLRVLVPLDGSAYAKIALEPAALLATALSAPDPAILHLVRVVTPPPEQLRHASESGYQIAHRHARMYLERMIEQIHGGFVAPLIKTLPITITSSVLVNRDIASALIAEAEDVQRGTKRCDLIAMATHGRSGFQRWILGSVTERVLHATRLPLFLVQPHAVDIPSLLASTGCEIEVTAES